MDFIFKVAYNLFIKIYYVAAVIASFTNLKAKKWLYARKNIFDSLSKAFQPNTEKIIWMHCASLGEFEQGRPVLEEIKKKHPAYKILLTFFSPSGYEIRKDYVHADHVFYLPLDTQKNAKKFIKIVKPDIAIFVKYEFWFNYIQILHNRNILTYLISAKFRENQFFFQWYGKPALKLLKLYTSIFLQDEDSYKLLKNNGIHNILIAGDTRFDRVTQQQPKQLPIIEKFKGDQPLLVVGSSWKAEEQMLRDILRRNISLFKNYKIIIAPHEVDHQNVQRVKNLFTEILPTVLYSAFESKSSAQCQVLIIDKIGLLGDIYQYGQFSIIGGGFNHGIHNILESSVYGAPSIFGPKYQNFKEANDLLNIAGAFTFSDVSGLEKILASLLSDAELLNSAQDVCKNYVMQHTGATKIVLDNIKFFQNY